MDRLARARALSRAVVAVAHEKQITVSASSLAYYAFNCLVALVVLTYAAFAVFGAPGSLARVLEVLTGVGAAEFEAAFEQVAGNASGRLRAVVLAAAITVWSSFRLFRAIDSVFTEVYDTRKDRRLGKQFVDSVVVLAVVTLGLGLLVAGGSLVVFRTSGWVWTAAAPLLAWLTLTPLFVPMYWVFSDANISVREALPGAAFAAAGWTVSTVGLRLYAGVSESVELYGAVGGVLLVLTWLYVVGLSVHAGAVLNALLAGHVEADEEWTPAEG